MVGILTAVRSRCVDRPGDAVGVGVAAVLELLPKRLDPKAIYSENKASTPRTTAAISLFRSLGDLPSKNAI